MESKPSLEAKKEKEEDDPARIGESID